MGILVGNKASVSGVLMLPVLGLNMAIRLVCSVEEQIMYLLICVQHNIMLFKGILAYILGCLGS